MSAAVSLKYLTTFICVWGTPAAVTSFEEISNIELVSYQIPLTPPERGVPDDPIFLIDGRGPLPQHVRRDPVSLRGLDFAWLFPSLDLDFTVPDFPGVTLRPNPALWSGGSLGPIEIGCSGLDCGPSTVFADFLPSGSSSGRGRTGSSPSSQGGGTPSFPKTTFEIFGGSPSGSGRPARPSAFADASPTPFSDASPPPPDIAPVPLPVSALLLMSAIVGLGAQSLRTRRARGA